MHILLDARLLLPHQMTGVGRYLLGLAQGFAQLDGPERFTLWVQAGLPAGHPIFDLHSPRLQVARVDTPHMSLRAQLDLPLALRRTPHDLLHYPHFDLPFLAPGPLVVTLHDLKYIARPDFFARQGRLRRLAMLAMMRNSVRRARRVIVDSDSTRRDVIARLGAAPGKLHVIPLAVDDGYAQPIAPDDLAAVLRRYDLAQPDGRPQPYVLFVGERRPHKNLPGLLRAFAALRALYADDPGAAPLLAIAGAAYAGDQQAEDCAAELGLTPFVRFIDRPPDADLPALYAAAGAFCLLSYYEGFGLPVLEAMSAGVPVVVANTTSLPEVAGQAGLCVPPDDAQTAALALRSVLPGGERRHACIAAGRAHAARFTWQRCAQATLDVYRAALVYRATLSN